VPVVWNVKDRKVRRGRSCARLFGPLTMRSEVSRSYRELFACDLKNVLERVDCRIVPLEAPGPKRAPGTTLRLSSSSTEAVPRNREPSGLVVSCPMSIWRAALCTLIAPMPTAIWRSWALR